MTIYWEHFYHEADIGVRGVGVTIEQAFEQTALAMMAVITDLELIKAEQFIEVNCQGEDVELLLVDWLNELVYEMATRHILFSRFDINIKDHHLNAKAWGEQVDIKRHHPAVEIKGATYTELVVKQLDDHRWLAQCVVDV